MNEGSSYITSIVGDGSISLKFHTECDSTALLCIELGKTVGVGNKRG
jgi:hypothetical protein